MNRAKNLLYYKFTPISDPETLRLWQKTLTDSLNLRGRILISSHGINGTIGGDLKDLKIYIKNTKQYAGFENIVYKSSNGGREDFPRMSVRVRSEIVAFLASDELRVFDDRMTINFSDRTNIIGRCQHCQSPTSDYENCAYSSCDDLMLICQTCKMKSDLLFHTSACCEMSVSESSQNQFFVGKRGSEQTLSAVTHSRTEPLHGMR